MEALSFLQAVSGFTQHEGQASSANRPVKFAVIDPAYLSNSYPGTLPKVTFEGESTLSGKRYMVLTPGYLPRAGDKVVMLPAGTTYVILGAVTQTAGTFYGPTAWTTWVPTWSAATTAPVLGNGTLVARYMQIGKTVHASMRLLMGATTTYGAGTYAFTLPVAPLATTGTNRVGSAYLRDASAASTGHFTGIVLLEPSVSATTVNIMAGPSAVGPTVPFTWASTDHLSWSLTYEAA